MAPYEYAKRFIGGKKILDAGTSYGYGAGCLAELAEEVIGIDINTEAVDGARQACQGKVNVKFITGSILEMDFPDGYFDAAISSQVVEHISLDKLDQYLSEMKRVLKKGGIFFISTLNLIRNLKGRSPQEYDKSPNHVKEFTPAELKQFLTTGNFSKVDVLGLRRSPRHALYSLLKKNSIFDRLPDRFNPVKKYYHDVIDTRDFVYSPRNLNKAFDLMGVCIK